MQKFLFLFFCTYSQKLIKRKNTKTLQNFVKTIFAKHNFAKKNFTKPISVVALTINCAKKLVEFSTITIYYC